MNIGERLKQWRTTKRLLQKEVGDLLGISSGVYQKYEMGVSAPGAGAMEAFCRVGINANWLLTGEGDMLLDSPTKLPASEIGHIDMQPEDRDDFSIVPLYDLEASAGHGAVVGKETQICQLVFRKDWIINKDLQKDKLAAIKAKGDSMEPTLHDGDLLLVDTRVEKIQDDSIYIILDDHHLIVKRVQRLPGGALTIISDNPRYKEYYLTPEQAETLKIAGRVCWYGHEI